MLQSAPQQGKELLDEEVSRVEFANSSVTWQDATGLRGADEPESPSVQRTSCMIMNLGLSVEEENLVSHCTTGTQFSVNLAAMGCEISCTYLEPCILSRPQTQVWTPNA